MSVLGEDLSKAKLDYYENGIASKKDLSFMLRTCFQNSITRIQYTHVNLFPVLAKFYLTPLERDLNKNCLAVRQFVHEVVNRRKAEN